MSAATATPAKKEEKTGLLATVANNARQYGIVGALLVIVVAFEVLTGGVLLKPNSFVSLIQQNAYVIILSALPGASCASAPVWPRSAWCPSR